MQINRFDCYRVFGSDNLFMLICLGFFITFAYHMDRSWFPLPSVLVLSPDWVYAYFLDMVCFSTAGACLSWSCIVWFCSWCCSIGIPLCSTGYFVCWFIPCLPLLCLTCLSTSNSLFSCILTNIAFSYLWASTLYGQVRICPFFPCLYFCLFMRSFIFLNLITLSFMPFLNCLLSHIMFLIITFTLLLF